VTAINHLEDAKVNEGALLNEGMLSLNGESLLNPTFHEYNSPKHYKLHVIGING
jgi:hypothetical protein